MAGGFAAIKDVPKLLVINYPVTAIRCPSNSERVITVTISELAPDQLMPTLCRLTSFRPDT